MQKRIITGVVPILVTPFDAEGGVDEASLRNLIEFNIAGGVHGVGVANGSELFKLSEAERALVVRIVVEAVARPRSSCDQHWRTGNGRFGWFQQGGRGCGC